jgi:hypothetical protein
MRRVLFFFILSSTLLFAEDDYDIYGNNATARPTSIPATTTKNKLSTSKNETSKFIVQNNSAKTLQYPYLEGQILTEYRFSNLVKKGIKDENDVDSYLYTNAEIGLNFNKHFFLYTEWNFQPVNSRLRTNDRYANLINVGNESNSDFFGMQNYIPRKTFHFYDYGLGVNAFSINFRNNNLAFGMGKFEASFAKGYDETKFTGINGLLIPNEYSLKNKIGGYLAALLPFGKIQFNLFYNDKTGLSDTMFKETGNDNKSGPGYNNSLNNMSLSVDAKIRDITVNFGLSSLKSAGEGLKTQLGYALGAEYLVDLKDGVELVTFGELVYLNSYKGVENRNAFYTTESAGLYFENWRFLLSNNFKYDNKVKESSFLNQILIGYKFDNGVMFDIGKVWNRISYLESSSSRISFEREYWTFMLSYLWEF